MLKDFFVNLSLLTAFLFLFSQMFRFKDFQPATSLLAKVRIGIVSGIFGIVLMFFTVRVDPSILLDMRHLTILIAANLGGIVAALLATVLISGERYLFFGGFNFSSITAILVMFLIAIGSGVIVRYIQNYWKRFGLSILYTSVVLSYALYFLAGPRTITVAPYYIGMIGFGGLFVMYLIHFLIKSNILEHEANSIRQELRDMLRLQQGLTFKFKKENGRFVYTLGEGQLLSRFGIEQQETAGKSIEDVFSEDKAAAIKPYYERAWSGRSVSFQSTLNGYTYFFSLTPVYAGETVKEVIATGVDITELKRTEKFLRESEQRFRLITSHSADLITIHLPDGTFSYLSPSCYTVLGYHPEELIGTFRKDLFHPDDWEHFMKSHIQTLKGPESNTFQFRFKKKNGEYIWLESTSNAVRDDRGMALEIISNTREITDRKLFERKLIEANEKLHRMSYTDGLTGVANRRYFDQLITQESEKLIAENGSLSVILFDIDDFKRFNDTYGHQEGDACLKRVAETIQGILDPLGYVTVRYGGEEFVILLPNTDEEQTFELAEILRTAVESLSIPHEHSQASNVVTISLGVACVCQMEQDVALDLIALADQALYQAKQNGRNCTELLVLSNNTKLLAQ